MHIIWDDLWISYIQMMPTKCLIQLQISYKWTDSDKSVYNSFPCHQLPVSHSNILVNRGEDVVIVVPAVE